MNRTEVMTALRELMVVVTEHFRPNKGNGRL